MKYKFLLAFILPFSLSSYSATTNQNKSEPEIRMLRILEPGSNFSIPETAVELFTEDPLAYIKENFSLETYITNNSQKTVNGFLVTFHSSKGNVTVKFDKNGKLLESFQRFSNTTVPRDLMFKVYEEYPGWEIYNFKHTAYGFQGTVLKEVFKFRIKNNNKAKRLTYKKEHQV